MFKMKGKLGQWERPAWFFAFHLLPHKLSASALSSHRGTLGNMALSGPGVWVSTVHRRLQSLSDDVLANLQKLKAEEKIPMGHSRILKS